MKFKITTDRVSKFKNGEEVESPNNELAPRTRMLMDMVRNKEAKWLDAPVKKKKVVKKSKKK